MSSKGIVIIDLDGCLTDYPRVFLSWVAENKGFSCDSLEAMKASMSRDDYEEIKHSYRISGVKRSLPVSSGVKEALEDLKRNGIDIWVVTTRPSWEPVFSDTKYWLNTNNLPYHELFFVSNKPEFIEQNLSKGIRVVIDDDYKVAEFVSSNQDVYALYFNKDHRVVTNKKIVVVNNWKEIQNYLKHTRLLLENTETMLS